MDVRGIGLGAPEKWTDVWLDDHTYRDEWGVVRAMPPGALYYDLVGAPLAEDATLSAIERHRWPDPNDPGRNRGLRERARRLHQETNYAVLLDLNCSFFLRCCELRGWENFYVDLVENVEFAEALMDRFLDIRLAIAGRALQEVGDNIDIVMVTSDDLGMTDRPLVSPALYRSLIKPRQKRTFWGAIDTRRVLPFGTPQEVREEVRRRIQDLGPGGGYVVCPVHNIQLDVPPENVVAMYDAAYELGCYPLKA